MYLTDGDSPLEMSAIASQLGMAQIGDVAFLKKFAKCRAWLSWMVAQMIPIDYLSDRVYLMDFPCYL